MMKNLLWVGLTAMVLMSSCRQPADEHAIEMPPGIDLTKMDQEVDPKKDFYRFANGKWMDETEIPGDEGRWGGFPELREKTNDNVLKIMEAAADNPDFQDGSDEKKAVDFFAVGMDSILAEKAGVAALASWMEKIDAVKAPGEVVDLVGEMHGTGYDPFFGVGSIPDLKNSTVNALYAFSGGLGLPNRDYYDKTDEKSVEIRDKYVAHVAKMLTLGGVTGDQTAMASQIMAIENQLAMASLTPIESRNIPALYNPMAISGLGEIAPQINWNKYLTDIGLDMSKADTIIVTEPKFMTAVGNIIARSPLAEVKAYLKWNVINNAANFMHHDMVKADFDFYGGVIRGTKEMKPRWERVLGSTNSVIGEAIGKVYVAKLFPPEAKATAEKMIANLKRAFEKRIKGLEWMSDSTKTQALNKLNKMAVKIGYPDKWKDYSGLKVERSGESFSYLGNMENAWKWQIKDNFSKLGKPVDKEEWGMSPQTVNAYFNPMNNEIVFPAAILQPPFYNYTADAAVNYGGIGAVIGHEISHGFDDQGSRFDADGNMVNWWTEEDNKNFEARTGKLVEQYDAYEPLDSVNVQGALTLGENIGDLGGLNAAYDALQIHLAEEGNPGPIDGYTPEQRLFISWATIWRTKYRDETLRTQIMTDPHSPGMIRAVGPLENMETFYKAFDIKEGDELYKAPEDRVIIW